MTNTVGNSVVIVDDDELSLEMVRALVEKNFSCRVFTANNGIAGLELARNVNPRLIILDLAMPYFSGFRIIETLREDEKYKHLPIIICTVITDAKTVEKAFDLKIAGFIKKPFMPEHFLAVLEKHLDKQSRQLILVVDDEEHHLRKVEQILTTHFPHDVLTVDSGIDGMEIMRDRPVQLVIADVEMPLIDGVRLLSFARDDRRLKHIPFLLAFDKNMDEDDYEDIIDEAGEYSYQGILKKPFDQEEVTEMVRKVLT